MHTRYFIVFGLITLMLIIGAEAKLPVKGDYVQIAVGTGSLEMFYVGHITDISDGLIGLNCTSGQLLGAGDTKVIIDRPQDICIGVGQISILQWLDRYGSPIRAT